MEGISIGFQLMFIGMVTVFLVLTLVVWTGKIIIAITNRLTPLSTTTQKQVAQHQRSHNTLSPAKIAAISAAVSQVTQGRGKITTIKKIE